MSVLSTFGPPNKRPQFSLILPIARCDISDWKEFLNDLFVVINFKPDCISIAQKGIRSYC